MIERTRKAKKAIPESLILSYFTQTLEALHYCHNRNIIHRGAPRWLIGVCMRNDKDDWAAR